MYYHVWQDTVHNDVACITWHSYNNGWVIHTITGIHTMTVDTQLYVLAVVLMCMCRHTERTHDTPIFCNWPEISWFCFIFYRVFKNIQKYHKTYKKNTSGWAPKNSSEIQAQFKRNSSGHVEPLKGHQTMFFSNELQIQAQIQAVQIQAQIQAAWKFNIFWKIYISTKYQVKDVISLLRADEVE